MNKTNLKQWGLEERFSSEAALYEGLHAGRVISQSRELYGVICENGVLTAEVSGKFRFGAVSSADYPAVGDFVMLDRDTGVNGNAVIHHVLSRKSAFVRQAAGASREAQVVASNIDTVFICMSLNRDFNPRRLERYLSVAWAGGALPVVVLTKSDLCAETRQRLQETSAVSAGTEILVVSALSGNGCAQLTHHIGEGKTAAFIGSSGVGKSTLINLLLGEERMDTKGLRNDDKGRHTTTRRELLLLPGGGMVIDTPGMKELGLESVDLSASFSDIEELAASCRFNDCAHGSEPGCAVQNALRAGQLSAERLSNWKKLKKEAKYDGLNSRQIENIKVSGIFGGMKNSRRFLKGNPKANR